MLYGEEDFLMISGIQHFNFCRRQWALIHIECIWSDNEYTASGTLMHKRAHDQSLTEKRGDLLIVRDMPVFSRELGASGRCDVVEFRRDSKGVSIFGRDGKWLPCPVEYKRGSSRKNDDSDRIQLCAQAICIEEMLACAPIETAYLYYGETRRREPVALDTALREKVCGALKEMYDCYTRGYTPRVKPRKVCASCSLKDACLPKLPSTNSVRLYIDSKTQGEAP